MYPNLLTDTTMRDLEVGPDPLEFIRVYNAGFHQVEGGHTIDDVVTRQCEDGAIAPALVVEPTPATTLVSTAVLVFVAVLVLAAPPALVAPPTPHAPAETKQFPRPERQSVWMECRETLQRLLHLLRPPTDVSAPDGGQRKRGTAS
jgi:hypothetical protein